MVTKSRELQTTWYPTNHIFAVIEDPGEARSAAEELRNAGFDAGCVQLFQGNEAKERINVACRNCNPAKRVLRFLWRFATLEGLLLREYEEAGMAGRQILALCVSSRDQVEQARRILIKHRARQIEYFGDRVRGSIAHLTSG